jgi:hypothetical protein
MMFNNVGDAGTDHKEKANRLPLVRGLDGDMQCPLPTAPQETIPGALTFPGVLIGVNSGAIPCRAGLSNQAGKS